MIKVDLKKIVDNSYNIYFEKDFSNLLSDFIKKNGYGKILIVSDLNVYPLYFDLVKNGIKCENVYGFQIKAGEENKNIEAVLNICKKLSDLNFSRNDILIALWWWVVGDIVGMASGIYKRWIDFIQIPTTLLSQIDSSVWWKTWVDFENIKNLIWLFKQPKLVIINPYFLKTLDFNEILSGYFEAFKHSIIDSEQYYNTFKKEWNVLLTKNFDKMFNVIERNIFVKAKIVMEDEKESGIRKYLNYWHTFGHALESESNFTLPHWICVAYGMIYSNILSNKLWYLEKNILLEINNTILEKLNAFTLPTVNFDKLFNKMLSDKKNTDSFISFVLIKNPWELFIEKIWDKKLLKDVYLEFLDFTKL